MAEQDSGYYGDPEDDSQSPSNGASDDSSDTSNDGDGSDTEKQSEDDSETFLTPKSAFSGDVSPGDKMQFQAVKVYDDEIEWKPLPQDDSSKSKPSGKPNQSANDEIDSMAMAGGS